MASQLLGVAEKAFIFGEGFGSWEPVASGGSASPSWGIKGEPAKQIVMRTFVVANVPSISASRLLCMDGMVRA